MSPYPTLDLPADVIDFRHLSVTYFHQYIVRKQAVEEAWAAYNLKLEECATFEAALEAKSPQCDEKQLAMRTNACSHASENKPGRERFGEEWSSLLSSYTMSKDEKDILQMDRIAEWETLKIVECLLIHIHSAVDDSVETGAPCPTIDSDPEGVNMTISDCHVVTRGCAFAWNHTFDRGDEFQGEGEGFDRGSGAGNRGVVYSDELVEHSALSADGLRMETGTWPINANSLTAHLCLVWCPIPTPCDDDLHSTPNDAKSHMLSHLDHCLPPVLPAPCTPAFVAMEQGSFVGSVQTEFEAAIQADTAYPQDALGNFLTGLSDAKWAGCAAPLVCIDCSGAAADEPVPSQTPARECHVSEQYLQPGESDASTFRCRDGACVSMSDRCNGDAQCGDESDEQECDTTYGTPAYLGVAESCPDDFNTDVYHRCGNSLCIEKVGLCNGHDNCGDNSDEAQCTGTFTVDVEATSGREITVERLQSHAKAFHDREYDFESLGSFSGKTFIKYSNDDKLTDHAHVMTKIRTSAPMTVFVVKMATDSLPWLIGQNYQLTSLSGLSFKGQRVINRGVAATEWEDTRHKEWDHTLNTEDSYTLSQVYSKTFPAGTISIPGNDGGDGSFLIFVDRPSEYTLMTRGNDGNGIVSSGGPDGASSIQFIDLGAGAFESAGELRSVRYHVSRTNTVQKFQIYRPVSGTTYRLVSETEAVSGTETGSIFEHQFTSALQFQAGDYIGWVHTGQGTFPFRGGGGSVRWRYGIQAVGSEIDFNGAGGRIYGYEVTYAA